MQRSRASVSVDFPEPVRPTINKCQSSTYGIADYGFTYSYTLPCFDEEAHVAQYRGPVLFERYSEMWMHRIE